MPSNSDTRRLRVVVTGDSTDAQQAITKVGQSADKTESKIGAMAKALAGWAARGAVALGAIGVAAGAMGLKTAMGLEQAEVGFTTMLGSAEKAKAFMKDLQKFAAATPFEFPELTSAAQQFLAMGFAAKDVIPMLTSVGDAVAAMGGSAENIDSITRALVQMQAKGKVSGEELMQLTEQGIPALQILADTYKVSTAQMSKMIEKGEVQSSRAIPALIAGLENGTKSVKGFGGMMAKQSETMAGKWSTFMDNLQTGLAQMVLKVEPQIKKLMDVSGKAIGDFFAGLQGKGKVEGFSGTINEIGLGITAMAQAFKEGDVTSDGLVGKFETMGVLLRELADAIKTVIDVVVTVVQWFMKHETVAKALAITIGALVAVVKLHALSLWISTGAAKAWLLQTTIITAATKTWTAVQWALNAAWAFSPIGVIVLAIIALIAVIIYAYKHSEKFRDIVQGAWKGIKAAAGAVADWFMQYLWPTMKAVGEGIGAAAMWLWNMMKTVWNAIMKYVSDVAAYFMNNIWPTFAAIFNFIGTALNLLYNVIWKPLWIAIQIAVMIFMAFWNNVLWPGIKATIDNIAAVMKWLWQNVIGPTWNGIKAIILAVVGWIMGTAWPQIQRTFQQIGAVVGILWDAFKLRFDAMKEKVSTVMSAVVSAFEHANAGIKKAWEAVQDIAKKPVNFIIGTVYNNGIRKLWNTVAEKFGISTRLDEIKQLAHGGVMPGYAPGRDTIPAMLSPGEGVLVPEAVKKIGPRRILDWNKKARAGQDVQMYKNGGIVGWGEDLLNKGKSVFQGFAADAMKPLVDNLRGIINTIPGAGGFSELLKGGANGLLDGFMRWVRGKDSEIPAGGGNWPPSPGAQRGDSGVWRSIVALIKSTGPLSGSFGNAYRPGDPLWHGSGRAVDWMGFNQDALAKFLAARKPLELIHRSSTQDYAYTRGVNKGSFNEVLMNQHRNHIHIAMDNGGVLPPHSTTTITNATSQREFALTEDKLKGLGGGAGVTITGPVTINVGSNSSRQQAKEIRDELLALAGRNGGRTGLPGK